MDPALEQLRTAAKALNVPLARGALAGLDAYIAELLRWRDRLNLTAASSPRDVVNPHLIDVCFAVSKTNLPSRGAVVDVGTGAGLPGIPMKLLRPDIEMALVEASRKKVAFLEHVRGVLGLDDIRIECGRAETIGRRTNWRERFDVAITQATAALNVAAEIILPFVKVGGTAVFLKGADIAGEIAKASALILDLGGRVESRSQEILPTTATMRTIVIIRKDRATPERFPRSARATGRSPSTHKGTRGRAAE